MKAKGVEEYLIELINQKYAKRVFSQMNTEHERAFLLAGSEPSAKEYEWMVKRAMEIHRSLNTSKGEDDAEEAEA